MAETRSTCPYCGVGCGVVIEHDAGRDHRRARRSRSSGQLRPALQQGPHAASDGGADRRWRRASRIRCGATRRARPRTPSRGTPRSTTPPTASRRASASTVPTAWRSTSRASCSPRTTTSSTSSRRDSIGTNNIDTNSRLCMSSAVAGYKQTLGADAPPACYEDIDYRAMPVHRGLEHGVGASDPVSAHRGGARAQSRNSGSIVVDPRRTATAARRRPASRHRARHRRRVVPRHAASHAVGRPASIATSSPRTRRASTR